MKKVFVIGVTDRPHPAIHRACDGITISQEGYDEYEKARGFILSREDNPVEITPYLFDSKMMRYFIYDIQVN